MERARRYPLQLMCIFALLLVACDQKNAAIQPPHQAAAASSAASRSPPTLAPTLVKVFPAVVSISVQGTKAASPNPLLQDPLFRHFFNLPKAPATERFIAAGSGVVIDSARGFIVTNNHLIESAQDIRVTLVDKNQYSARLVGTDPPTDIAVLRIDAPNLSALALAEPKALQVGDYVVAVGNPFGVGETATFGIVSALGRSGLGIESYENFIQTDASINPGNSGGALVNISGELVGMNTAILSRSGGNVGLGFAIPADIIKAVTGQLIAMGKVSRGAIGIAIQDITPLLARALGLSGHAGALVSEVKSGSSAAAAGLKPGDIITGLNGLPLADGADLRNKVGQMQPGVGITLQYQRNGQTREASFTLQPAPAVKIVAPVTNNAPEPPDASLGLKLEPVPPSDPRYGKTKGAMVAGVIAASPAAFAGLQEGDIIVAVDKSPAASPEEVLHLVQAHRPSRPLLMEVRRDNTTLFIAIER